MASSSTDGTPARRSDGDDAVDARDEPTAGTVREPTVALPEDPDVQAVIDRYETILQARSGRPEAEDRSPDDRGPLRRFLDWLRRR
jgi:hypothetical protein